jgi:tRNA (guanine37-N1)-methyltransferase
MNRALKALLKNKLTKRQLELLPSSYDIIGSILVFADFPKELVKKEKTIGNALLALHKNVKTVCRKTKKFSGRYRTPKLKIMAGEKTKETIHKENNATMKLDIEKVYFSPRLSSERKRIWQMVKPKESVLVMFSGCGIYPIVISKNAFPKEIYSIEINPTAFKYQQENIKINKAGNIKALKGDVRKVLPKINKKFDRIIMPLPKGGGSFLDLALSKIKRKGTIHFYDFLAEDELDAAKEKISKACKKARKKCKILAIVKCGQFSPRKYRICVDFKVN